MSTSTRIITPLRQRMVDDMRIRNLADNTQLAYLQQIIAYRTLSSLARRTRSGSNSRLSALSNTDSEAFAEQCQYRHRRVALSIQSHAQTRLGHR